MISCSADAVPFRDELDAFPFVHGRVEDFQHFDVIRRTKRLWQTIRSANASFSDHFIFAASCGGGDDADSNRVLVRMIRQPRHRYDLGRGDLHPMLRRAVERQVRRHKIVEARRTGVLQRQDRVAGRLQVSRKLPSQRRLHHHAMQNDFIFRVDDHRAADEHRRVVMLDRFEHRAALGPVASGCEAHQQPGVERLADCLFRSRRDGSRRR